mmetsp:Transcript_6108/g.12246  ORF Transcript_6108/g.12246 Transcript_6108/m.12246 type:complete len:92 (+) Transcript_6108:751-1026(+)
MLINPLATNLATPLYNASKTRITGFSIYDFPLSLKSFTLCFEQYQGWKSCIKKKSRLAVKARVQNRKMVPVGSSTLRCSWTYLYLANAHAI